MRKLISLILAIFLGLPLASFAMTSTNYQIEWDSINIGGVDVSTSTNYTLRDTVGEHGTGVSTSTNYELSAGYRAGGSATPYLAFDIGTQEDATQTTWSAFSNAGLTVTVATSSGYAVGNLIAVVENEGFAQLVAVGKVTDVSGTIVTVDDWEGEPALLSASPSGGDDYVYRLNGSSASLGMTAIISENTAITATDVVSNAANGYTVTVEGLDAFDSGAVTLQSVADGAVTAGSEEYGIESVGTRAYGAGSDVSIPVLSTRTVQSSSDAGSHDRVAVVYKLAVSPSTPTGSYSQSVIYRVTGNF